MPIELKVPEVGESITDVQIGTWLKKVGDTVRRDEPVVTIETDKVTVELPAPAEGVISQVLVEEGTEATVGQVIGYLGDKLRRHQGFISLYIDNNGVRILFMTNYYTGSFSNPVSP